MLSLHAPVQQPLSAPAPRVVDTRPTVLITEQQVKLLTAAAIAAPPAKAGLFSRWIASHRAAREARSEHWRYTTHYDFLENAAMARAMERL
jgi:hypothetical protein